MLWKAPSGSSAQPKSKEARSTSHIGGGGFVKPQGAKRVHHFFPATPHPPSRMSCSSHIPMFHRTFSDIPLQELEGTGPFEVARSESVELVVHRFEDFNPSYEFRKVEPWHRLPEGQLRFGFRV